MLRARPLVVLVVGMLVFPVVSTVADARPLDQIQRDLSEAQEEREHIEARLAATVEEFAQLETRIAEVEDERDLLRSRLAQLREELAELDELVAFRVRETFKHGSGLDPLLVFLASDDPAAGLTRATTVQRLVAGDQATGERLTAARASVAATERRLADRIAELETADIRLQELAAQLETDFEAASSLESRLQDEERTERDRLERERLERERREREERQRREAARRAAAAGAAPATSGGMVCPLDRPRHYTDTWGAPRGGGRGHRGVDIMGPRGIPVRAIASGVWERRPYGGSAGNWGVLKADNGDHYWYLHLDQHTASSGRVSAGQQLGTNGSTGNATPGAEHLHLERHPGGGSAVNPYPLVRSICG